MSRKDLSGSKFGRLSVQDEYEIRKRRRTYWRCICDCGKEKWVSISSLRAGTKSCGCLALELKSLEPGKSAKNRFFRRYKTDAKKRSLNFNLNFEEFISLCHQDCFYCGNMPTKVLRETSNGDFVHNGVDRIDSNIGYTISNCVSCCSKCNFAKGRLTQSEFFLMIERIYRHRIISKGETKHKKRAAFFGRWQPFHKGHMWLIKNKLDKGIPCVIFVRDIPPDKKNPYTTQDTIEVIKKAFKNEDVIVQALPDIESINWGRGVGYETNEFKPPEDIKRISATDIRDKIMSNDDSWKEFVTTPVAEWLEEYYG